MLHERCCTHMHIGYDPHVAHHTHTNEGDVESEYKLDVWLLTRQCFDLLVW
jgi:hypothetical protein